LPLDAFLHDPLSRRRFFRTAGVSVAGSSAVFLVACGNSGNGASAGGGTGGDTKSGQASDVDLLNAALDLEHMAVAAYTAGAKLLKGDALQVGKLFLMHEQEHAAGLEQAIKQMGGKPNAPKTAYDFPRLSSQTDVLHFANDLEHTAVRAYVDALPRLREPALRATAAAIAANEAEHIAALLNALGEEPVPDAFVTGEQPS